MSLQLDARQRAMLKEMGVPVWLPGTDFGLQVPAPAPVHGRPAVSPAPVALPQRPPRDAGAGPGRALEPALSAPLAQAAPAPAPQGDSADWSSLVARVAACQACPLHAGRSQCLLRADAAPVQADWLVVVDPPEEAQERGQAAVVGDAAVLLDNMLKAVGVSRQGSGAQGAYVTAVAKCRAPHATMPSAQDLQQCLAHLRAEIALVRPRLVLLMGRFAQQLVQLHGGAAPAALDTLRGTVYQLEGLPTVLTYPPAILLRNSSNKAKAWADLCLALDTLEAAP